jgi:uncharacterized protein YjiS (DUF1127 family)
MTTLTKVTHNATTAQLAGRLRYLIGMSFSQLLDNILTWQQRHSERRYLLTLDQRMLKDIGLSQADIQQEAAKPFWQK